jgi:hypothetical protein
MPEPEAAPPPNAPGSVNGTKLLHALVWPVLILLALVIISSIGVVAVALFTHIEPTSTIARMIGEGRSLTRMAAVVVITPLIGVLCLTDKVEGSAAIAALSAIAGYVLGSSTGQQ